MAEINYMKYKLLLPHLTKEQLKDSDLEMTLVHRLMEKNGWDFPTGKDDSTDYDSAVEQVKWFIEQLISLT